MTTTTALDTRWVAVRAGLWRGWIETRQNFTETAYVIGHAIPPVAYVAMLLFMRGVTRGKTVPGTDFSLVTMVLPSLLGMTIVYGGLSGPAPSITADREDGTLLRAKATPNTNSPALNMRPVVISKALRLVAAQRVKIGLVLKKRTASATR